MIGDPPRAPGEMHAEVERRAHRIPAHRNRPMGRVGGRYPSCAPSQRFAVWRRTPADRDSSSSHRRSGDSRGALRSAADVDVLRESDGFKRLLRAQPQQHFLCSTPGGNESHAHFDESHVAFCRGLHAIAVQHDFAAASERQCRTARRRPARPSSEGPGSTF